MKTELVVNGPAVLRSSMGVRRYYQSVMRHLDWPGDVRVSGATRWPMLDRAAELLRPGPADAVLWSPCQRGPLLAPCHVVTVHDCISIEYTYRDDWRLPAYRLLSGAILNRAKRVVAISNATRAAILRNFRLDESKIVVIRSGLDPLAGSEGPVEAAPAADEPFVLMVVNSLPHKNATAACLAFGRSRAARQGLALRVVGSLPDDAHAACSAAGVRLQLHRHVTDAQLARWYAQCLFLLSPSLDEGHNLPVAEALGCGANVLCSDIPVHREYYDGAVAFFDARSTDAMTQAIDQAIDRGGRWPDRRSAVQRRTFADVAHDYRALFLSLQ